MNIFVLDSDPVKCCEYHVDRHCVKQVLEYAQMLSTTHHVIDKSTPPYKATHQNHPCSIWTRMTKGNYQWLFGLTFQLCLEYSYRYERLHKTFTDALPFLADPPRNIDPSMEVTEFALAMPDDCKTSGDPVESYRSYYRAHKSHLFSWKKREIPFWINQ